MQRSTADRFYRLREASAPYGVFTTATAIRNGISRSLLHYYLRRGMLLRNEFDRTIYRFDPPAEHESIVDAALVAGPEAVASHVTALRLHDLTDLAPQGIEFTLPRSRRSRRPPAPLKFYFNSEAFKPDEVVFVKGIPVTSAARSLVDVARGTGRPDQIERGIAEAIERRLASRSDLLRELERIRMSPEDREWFSDAVARST